MISYTYFADVRQTLKIAQTLSENTFWNKALKQFFILCRRLSLDLIKNPVHSTHMLFMCPPGSSRLDPAHSISLKLTFIILIMVTLQIDRNEVVFYIC